jgi:hypothetical protein
MRNRAGKSKREKASVKRRARLDRFMETSGIGRDAADRDMSVT